MTTKSMIKVADQIKKDLFSQDDTVVLTAIQRCAEQGNALLVEPLIAFYATDADPALKKEVAELLGALKISGVEDYFMDALRNPTMSHIHRDLVSFIWSSNIQPVEHIAEITKIAVANKFEVTLECLTLLESIEDAVPKPVLVESTSIVNDYLGNNPKSENAVLLVEYKSLLEDMLAYAE